MDSETRDKLNRNYFLTVQPNAECYNDFEVRLHNILNCDYAWIYHKAENDTENNGHIHCIIKFKNARSYDSVLKRFPGAHIEVCRYVIACLRYLVHLDDKSKIQYDEKEVHQTNNIFTNAITYDESRILTFSYDNLVYAIDNGLIWDLVSCCRVFGVHATNTYRGLVSDILREHSNNEHDNDKLLIKISDLTQQNEYYKCELERLRDELNKGVTLL